MNAVRFLNFSKVLLLGFLLSIVILPASAGEVLLSANRDAGISEFFIEGEPSLVMNVFDLNARGIGTPAQIDAVAISVLQAVPGVPIDVLIYEDFTPGSPADSTLVGRTQTTINTTGVTRIPIPAVTVEAPFVWVGLYLPLNFRFAGDTSGSSSTTWWAWQPGGVFEPTSLVNAPILGPGDGSAPVNINMGGIARITAEISSTSTTLAPATAPVANPSTNTSINFSTASTIPAGQGLLSANRGTGISQFFIEGEPSLVMNAFDLNARGISTPAQINAIAISVIQTVPNVPIDVLIYEDFTPGSPADSRLVGRTQTTINTTGVVRISIPPVSVNAPLVWVGLYLPVGFQFAGDTSGTSSTTWWAWQPGGVFDPGSLANAPVLGPGNGASPVGIDMSGVARITAEISSGDRTAPVPEDELVNFSAGNVSISTNITPGQVLLDYNIGTGQVEYFIDGESTLVMNGFDMRLSSAGTEFFVNSVYISLLEVLPGLPIEAVVYADDDGGSPVNARVVARSRTSVTTPGVTRITFDEPVRVSTPVLWVGFYLPPGFKFAADDSGTGGLTWWAWQPSSTFNLDSLASAAVLGPGDGTDPVAIDMQGTARITAAVSAIGSTISSTGLPTQTTLIDRDPQPVPSNLIAPGQNFPTEPRTVQLSNNTGADLNEFFIDGEPTLVINGFDLSTLGVDTPAEISALGLTVTSPIPGVPIDVVIYEDPNGGSPVDSVLVGRNRVFINAAGSLRVPFPEPVRVNSSIIWVGFYMPVGMRFAGDSSGSSVLTWWAWQPAGTFDITSLSNAAVLGAADGTDPVGVDMGGIARITVEATPVDFIPEPEERTPENAPIGIQLLDDTGADLSTLQAYPYCNNLSYDTADIANASDSFTIECRADVFQSSAGRFINLDDTPSGIIDFERVGYLYDLKAYGDYQREGSPFATELKVPVTHCMRPEQIHLERAVIGLRFASPGNWKILPTVRFGELICAEVEHEGLITYFIPRDGSESTINADYDFSGPMRIDGINNEGTTCGRFVALRWAVHNEGFVTLPSTTLRIQDAHISSGLIEGGVDIPLGPLQPDETIESFYLYRLPTTNIRTLHRIELIIDPNNLVPELNESNNIISLEYILEPALSGC